MLTILDHHIVQKDYYKWRYSQGDTPHLSQNRFKSGSRVNIRVSSNKPLGKSSTTVKYPKGLSFGMKMPSFFQREVKDIPDRLLAKALDIVKKSNAEHHKLYLKYIQDFISEIKNNERFRTVLGVSPEKANELTLEHIIKIPKRKTFHQFLTVLYEPLKWARKVLYKFLSLKIFEKIMPSIHKNVKKRLDEYKIICNYKNVIGLTEFIKITENKYRALAGHKMWDGSSKFYIPDDLLEQKVNLLRLNTLNPEKGQYSAKNLSLGNRLVSGSIYAIFLANDAYNTTMRYSNDKTSANSQKTSRAKQEGAKIAFNMYIQNLLLDTFEKQINKSLFNALLVSGITVGASEVLGRILLGRSIVPSDKAHLDKLEDNMQNKKGVFPTIGRLITNTKPNKNLNNKAKISLPNSIEVSPYSFKSDETPNVAFKALKMPAHSFEIKKLKQLLNLIKNVDENQYNMISQIVTKSKKMEGSLLDNLEKYNNQNIEIGYDNTLAIKAQKGFFAPIFLIIRWSKALFNGARKAFNQLRGIGEKVKFEDMQKELKRYNLEKEFEKYFDSRMKLPVWQESILSLEEKQSNILAEFLELQEIQKKEIEGVKNFFVLLEKRLEKLNIKIDTKDKNEIQKIRDIINDLLCKADGSNHTNYDGNKFMQFNIHLARLIATIFLVTDSYNLTMQYSNDNKKEAIKTAQNRTVQEASRMASSAYIMAIAHNILSKFCNGSLLGAWTTAAITSSTSDALARAAIGIPIRKKDKEQLDEIDKKNQQSKNPFQKMVAYSIGKKSA